MPATPPSTKKPDWYLQEWMAHFRKKQAALVNELGWNKSKANFYWHGRQEYRKTVVNEIAQWLGIFPYELLMPPEEALSLRRLRDTAYAIAAEHAAAYKHDAPARSSKTPAPKRRTGR